MRALHAAPILLAVTTVAAAQAPASPERRVTAAAIPGVIAEGTPVERVWTGMRSADGIAGAADGSLLFTEQDASRVSRLKADGSVELFVEDTWNAGALGIDAKGRVIAVERRGQGTPDPQGRVAVYTSSDRSVLASGFEGRPFQALRDLVVDRRGGVYITDGQPAPARSVIYYIDPAGRITKASDAVGAANGVLLSPDEKTMYVTDTPSGSLVAFDVPADGTITNMRPFGRLEGGDRRGADGLAIDADGRVYAATPVGVQVFSPGGQHLGTIPTPRPATSVAFAGAGKAFLYIVGRGNDGPEGASQWARSMYRVPMVARGFAGRAK